MKKYTDTELLEEILDCFFESRNILWLHGTAGTALCVDRKFYPQLLKRKREMLKRNEPNARYKRIYAPHSAL